MDRRKQAKHRQRMIIGAVVAVAAVFVLVVVGLKLSGDSGVVDESIFENSDNRLVVSMGAEIASLEDGEYEPGITRMVYYHNGKNITGLETYFEYENEEEAKEAYEHISLDGKDWAKSKKLKGKFIVFDVMPDQYNMLTADQVKKIVDDMRAAGSLLEE